MMKQPNDDDKSAPRVPPGNFNLIEHPFRPTRNYTPIEGLADRIQELEYHRRFRSALDEIFKALDNHPGHPEALMLATILLYEGRTERLHAEEPIPDSYLLDTRLDPIYAVCSHCRRKEWVPATTLMMHYAKLGLWNPTGQQCYNCGYVVCRDCMQRFPYGVGFADISRTCPYCHEEALDIPVFPTGRLPHQMRRQAGSFVRVIVFREGPVPPDGEYIKKLMERVSPDVLESKTTTLTAFPVPAWPDDIDGLADAILVRMEAEGKLPAGSMLNTERAHVQDEYGMRCFVVKVVSEKTLYDLSQLHLPREGRSFEEELEDQKRVMAAQTGSGSVKIYVNCQDLAQEQETDSPVVRALNGHAFVVLRVEGLSAGEAQHMRGAIEKGRILLVPVLAQCPTFPVLGLRFIIYDNLTNPYIAEAPRGIHHASVQDFLQAVLRSGSGDFYLYTGVNAEPLGSGGFLLRMPPFAGSGYPYRTQPADIRNFWSLLDLAAQHLASIPMASRNFEAALRLYLEHTSLTEG